ncbi:MAG: hypothetical protein HDS37_01040 [Bacteroides sp.]|nr:hypothetical protein [Bacteroides sp.]
MKRTTLGFLTVLLTGYGMSAREISPSEAMSVASDFMNSTELRTSASATSALRPMMAPGVNADAQASPYYVFNRGESDGFVIISGDDRAPKILGYSDRGSFDGENLPPQLKAMMEQWTEHMEQLPEGASQHASWSKGPSTRAGEGILLETAEWGQGYPYNALCPVIEGEQAPTGCIATAMAIAMKYHNWPDYTRGDAEEDFECPEVKFDFSNYTIDWNVLADSNSSAFANEVSKLMLSLGVAAQMYYGPMESSAYDWPYAHKMIEKYSYGKDCQFIERSAFSDSEWTSMLQMQLEEVGPVIYRGSNSVGHAFIIDGFDGASLYHVNWGWDGLMNGYYTLDFTEMGFDQYQGMVINIIPDKERHVYSKAFIPNVQAYIGGLAGCGDWNFMNPNIVPGEKNRVRIPDMCLNLHEGAFGIAVVDEDDNILQILDGFTYNSGYRYSCPWPGSDDALDIVFPELKEGERYQLVSSEIPSSIFPGYAPIHEATKDPKDWQIVLGGITRPSHFYMTGNRSDVAEVNFHIDEKLPFMFCINCKSDDEFTLKELKGHCIPDNVVIPSKGVSYDIKCYDKDGNPEEPVISIGDFMGGNYLSFNISMYSNKYDFYLNYEYDGDTRRDNSVPSDSIIEQDGLVFRLIKDAVSLIGYDKVSEELVIPDFVTVGDSQFPVVEIENEALMFAPIKKLIIKASNLDKIGDLSFAGIEGLSAVSFEDAHCSTNYLTKPFLKSDIKDVYFDTVDVNPLIYALTGANFDGIYKMGIANDDISFYFSELPSTPSDINYYWTVFSLSEMAETSYGVDKIANVFCFPGTGGMDINECYGNGRFPYMEMWKYELDKRHRLLSISDVLDNVEIQKVTVNGVVVEKDSMGLYKYYNYENNDVDVDVIVEYSINGGRKMTTHYSAIYNYWVSETDFMPSLNGDANNDGVVNIADAVNAANFLVGLPTTDFDFEAADTNADGEITVSDITSIIALIPMQSYAKHPSNGMAYVKREASGYLVSSQSIVDGQIELSLASDEKLTAIQFDLQVSVGTSIPVIMLSDKVSSTHSIKTFMMDSNTVRVIVYSANGNLLSNNATDHILDIKSTVSADELMFENIFASSISGQSISLGHEGLSDTNGVQDSPIGMPKVSSANGRIVVENAEGLSIDVYSLDGSCVDRFVSKSERVEIPLSQGMYIVTVDNSSYKVIIR